MNRNTICSGEKTIEAKQAQQETRYRLIMILVKSMERDDLISAEEREMIRKKLVERLKPLIGQLEQPEVGI